MTCSHTKTVGSWQRREDYDPMLRTGVVGQGNTFIQKMRERVVNLENRLSEVEK